MAIITQNGMKMQLMVFFTLHNPKIKMHYRNENSLFDEYLSMGRK